MRYVKEMMTGRPAAEVAEWRVRDCDWEGFGTVTLVTEWRSRGSRKWRPGAKVELPRVFLHIEPFGRMQELQSIIGMMKMGV